MFTMDKNLKNRAAGAVKELGGKIEKTVGKVIGNEQMQIEGKAKELQGKARKSIND